jgi:hypothetical protein
MVQQLDSSSLVGKGINVFENHAKLTAGASARNSGFFYY